MANIVLGIVANVLSVQRLIDSGAAPVNAVHMDLDEVFAKSPGDPLAQLVRQDLDPLSVEELEARIAALSQEIQRCERRKKEAVNHRATADAIFKR